VRTRFSMPIQNGPPSQGQSSWSMALNHPPPSSAKFQGRVKMYLYLPLCAFMACYKVNFTFTEIY
jgi:hypothetical protein